MSAESVSKARHPRPEAPRRGLEGRSRAGRRRKRPLDPSRPFAFAKGASTMRSGGVRRPPCARRGARPARRDVSTGSHCFGVRQGDRAGHRPTSAFVTPKPRSVSRHAPTTTLRVVPSPVPLTLHGGGYGRPAPAPILPSLRGRGTARRAGEGAVLSGCLGTRLSPLAGKPMNSKEGR